LKGTRPLLWTSDTRLRIQLISQAKNIQMSVDELSCQLMSEFENHSKYVQENISKSHPAEATPEGSTPASSYHIKVAHHSPGELQSLSLIKIWDRGTKLSIHGLLLCVVRENLQQDRLNKQKQVLPVGSSAFDYSPGSDSRTLYRKFLPQITACLLHLDEEVYHLFSLFPLSDSLAVFLFDETQILKCQNLNKRLLDIRSRTLGPII
jgi:hypothetical protein